MKRLSFIRAGLLLATLTALPAQAQQAGVVRGVVSGPDGKALPAQTVVLHRVMGTTGVTVATGTSSADGTFRLDVPAADASSDAVYFLAARFDNELYIGDAFRAPFDSVTIHAVQVGVAATSARNLVSDDAQAVMPPAPAAPDPTRRLVWILPALAIAALIGMLTIGRTRVPDRRRALLALAELDEARHPNTATVDDAALRARRDELVTRAARPAL